MAVGPERARCGRENPSGPESVACVGERHRYRTSSCLQVITPIEARRTRAGLPRSSVAFLEASSLVPTTGDGPTGTLYMVCFTWSNGVQQCRHQRSPAEADT